MAEECLGAGVWVDSMLTKFHTAESYTSIFIAVLFAIGKALDFALSTPHDRKAFFQIHCFLKSFETTKINWAISFVRFVNKSITVTLVSMVMSRLIILAGSTGDLES